MTKNNWHGGTHGIRVSHMKTNCLICEKSRKSATRTGVCRACFEKFYKNYFKVEGYCEDCQYDLNFDEPEYTLLCFIQKHGFIEYEVE
jgi:uncharacterized protein (DUF983 family)